MNYSKNRIFEDSRVNALIDLIYHHIGQSGIDVKLDEVFCLSGRAAAILQGAVEKECENIIFMVGQQSLYDFLLNELPAKVKHSGVAKYQDRVLYYFENAFIEFWFTQDLIRTAEIDGIVVEYLDNINEILL